MNPEYIENLPVFEREFQMNMLLSTMKTELEGKKNARKQTAS